MTYLSLNFLGELQVRIDDQLVDLAYNKVRALLAYLTVEASHPHSRDELATLLWPDSPETTARKNLRQALATLRASIQDEFAEPPFLIITRETIQLNPRSNFAADVLGFMHIMAQCQVHAHAALETCPTCIEQLARAAALYQGELLKGFSIPDSLPFEEWLLLTREHLCLNMIDILGHLSTAYERKAMDEMAMQVSRQRISLEPWNEEAYRTLMRILYRRGQRAAALAEFERCKRVLSEELGIYPSQETVDLYNRMCRGTGSLVLRSLPAAPDLPRLPIPLTPLVGREKELSTLCELILRREVRLVTLMGPPGIGKTRLSIQVAAELVQEYGSDLTFVPLSAITDPALVIPTIVMVLGLSESESPPFYQLVHALRNKKALLILNNFEHLRGAAPAIVQVLQACPQLTILVTSRSPLNLPGEQRFALAPLELPNLSCLPEFSHLSQVASIKLFVERAQAVVPGFTLTSLNIRPIAAICVRLDGLPLAIELAAAWVRVMPAQVLLERLTGAYGLRLHLLTEQVRSGEAHSQTLRQAIQWSFDLLEEPLKTLFARLGVFINGWTLDAAEQVCAVGNLPGSLLAAGIASGLAALLDNSLVAQSETASGEYRFYMLAPLREFALELLEANGEMPLLRRQHAVYFLSLARQAEIQGAQLIPAAQVESELNNLRAALQWIRENDPEQSQPLERALENAQLNASQGCTP